MNPFGWARSPEASARCGERRKLRRARLLACAPLDILPLFPLSVIDITNSPHLPGLASDHDTWYQVKMWVSSKSSKGGSSKRS